MAPLRAIIAPARNCAQASHPGIEPCGPPFLGDALRLADAVRRYDPWQLESLLDVNPLRALELHAQYQRFGRGDASPALLSYYGAAYRAMRPSAFTPGNWDYARRHLRILSALYGLLGPADGIEPHRLGMNFRYRGGDLYAFWGDRLYRRLDEEGGVLVNLASEEYARLVAPHYPPERVVTCRFLRNKGGRTRGTVSTVRAARGLMARYMVEHRVEHPRELLGFDAEGYRFYPHLSDERSYVFVADAEK